MKFQYISDLHLEFGNKVKLEKLADYLILAGDICKLKYKNVFYNFIKEVSEEFKLVFFVTGNHEYYNSDISSVNSLIEEIFNEFENVIFLNNKIYEFSDSEVVIFGTTLWTHIPEEKTKIIKKKMNDYFYIKNFTPKDSTKLFNKNYTFIKETIKNYSNKKLIFVSHHLPQMYLIDKEYQGSDINYAFASDIPELDNSCVVACVYGHTHTNSIQGKYYCNPLGYPNENKKRNLNKIFEIKF